MEFDVSSISALLATVGVMAGVALAVLELRHLHDQKQTDLVIRLYSTSVSSKYRDALMKVMSLQFIDYEDYVKRYGQVQSMTPNGEAINEVCKPFELIGTLLLRKHVNLGIVYDVFGTAQIKQVFEKIKPLLPGIRREFNERFALAGFEYLYHEILKREPQLRRTWEKASFSE